MNKLIFTSRITASTKKDIIEELKFFIVSLEVGSCGGGSSDSEDTLKSTWKLKELKKKCRGFSLIEMIVSLGIVMIIFASLLGFFVSQNQAYSSQTIQLEALQDARVALYTLMVDIRSAGLNAGGNPLGGIVSANGQSIRVQADANQDGNISGDDEDITILCSNGVLTRNGLTLLSNVGEFSFSYTLVDGTVTSTPADPIQIRKITVNLIAQSQGLDPITKAYRQINFTSDVTPRNLGLR
jgi:type II secretory pathway component PulJ